MLYNGQKRPPDAPDHDPGGLGRVQEGDHNFLNFVLFLLNKDLF